MAINFLSAAMKFPRVVGRALIVLVGAVALRARAALWEDPLWALSGQASATVGYDTNLFAINDGPGDAFASFKPMLDLSRKDSLLSFDAEAWVDWTTFLRQTASDASDPGVRLLLSYPANVETWVTQSAEVHWTRTTEVNVDVGQRISQEDALAKYEGDVIDTGKTSVVARVLLERDDYLGAEFDTIDTASAGTSVNYTPNDLFRAGLGYDLTIGKSQPNSPGLAALDQTEQAFTVRAEGEFTPLITGKVSLGAAYSDYTGSYSYSEWDMVAAADITWRPRERLAFDLQVVRVPSFSADGDIDVSTSVILEATQELGRGIAIKAHAQGGRTDHERTVTYRTDEIAGAGVAADYDLTGKLTASVGCNWTRQDSDVLRYTYRRYLATGQLMYKF
jgi:hypothetical protein